MRTIGFRSNVLFVIAAAVGLLASLDRAWYARSPVQTPEEARIGDVQGPVEQFFSRLAREFSTASGTTGWHAFTTTDTLLTILAVIAMMSAVGTIIIPIQQPCREVLRAVTLAMLGIVVVKLVNTPDALVERRQGAWIALFATGIMATSAATIYGSPPLRRRKAFVGEPTPLLTLPARSHVFDTPGATIRQESAEPTPPPAV